MSIVKMSYQCQCGAILKIEDKEIIAGAMALQYELVVHEDEACG